MKIYFAGNSYNDERESTWNCGIIDCFLFGIVTMGGYKKINLKYGWNFVKIYMAGNITEVREKVYYEIMPNRLFTYYYHGEEKEFSAEFLWRVCK